MAFKSKWFDRWLARSFHIFLTTGITLILFLKDTELKRALDEKRLLYPACFLILVGLSTISYMITSLMNPGYVNQKSNVNIEDGFMMETKEPTDQHAEVSNNPEENENQSRQVA
eukprot:gene15720-17305_t